MAGGVCGLEAATHLTQSFRMKDTTVASEKGYSPSLIPPAARPNGPTPGTLGGRGDVGNGGIGENGGGEGGGGDGGVGRSADDGACVGW